VAESSTVTASAGSSEAPEQEAASVVASPRTDDGFTLMECVVALMIATMMFLALAMSLGSSLKASLTSRSNQQAIDLANDQLEQMRTLDFAALSMSTTDSTNAADTCASGTSLWCLTTSSPRQLQYPNPSGSGVLTETVYAAAGAGVPTHVKACRTGLPFTCKIYVTSPTDAAAVSYRRVSVAVQWTDPSGTHTRFSSSYVTASRRGLPSPAYTWAATPNNPNANVGIAAGGRGAFFAMLTNQGIPLRWNLSLTAKIGSTVQPWSVQWFQDTDCSGSWNTATETTSLDSDGNGTGDTGIVPTDGRVCVIGVLYVPTGTADANAPVSLTATPNTATPSSDYTAAVPVTGSATISGSGISYRTLNLHNWTDTNGTATADSTGPAAGVYNKLTTVPPGASGLYNFDTNLNTDPGVTISTATSATWRYGLSNDATLGGTSGNQGYATIDFYAVSDDLNAFTSTNVQVALRVETSANSFVPYGNPTVVPVTGNTGFGHFRAVIPVGIQAMLKARNVELQLSVPSGSAPVRLAFDTTGAPATLVLPFSTGTP
jgi:prepilin-type N-terminal cleavage/methylation domain-containing protein